MSTADCTWRDGSFNVGVQMDDHQLSLILIGPFEATRRKALDWSEEGSKRCTRWRTLDQVELGWPSKRRGETGRMATKLTLAGA